jgi:heme-binding protein
MNSKKNMSAKTVRRGLYGMFAGGLLGGVASAAMIMPSANAAPETCSFSQIASTTSTVSASTSSYLAAHPETNEALTNIAKQPMDEAQISYRAYFADHPQAENDLQAINRPAQDLTTQCGMPVRATPISEALQGV